VRSATMIPRTFLQRLVSRWLRWCGMAAIWIGLGVAALAVPDLMTRMEALVAPTSTLPVLPATPHLRVPALIARPIPDAGLLNPPIPGAFLIEVAVFKTSARALFVVKQLSTSGYRVFAQAVDFGPGGVRHQVLVGPYATHAAAESDLMRLKQIPGYEDASLEQANAADSLPADDDLPAARR
jgi:hypothetical protein